MMSARRRKEAGLQPLEQAQTCLEKGAKDVDQQGNAQR